MLTVKTIGMNGDLVLLYKHIGVIIEREKNQIDDFLVYDSSVQALVNVEASAVSRI